MLCLLPRLRLCSRLSNVPVRTLGKAVALDRVKGVGVLRDRTTVWCSGQGLQVSLPWLSAGMGYLPQVTLQLDVSKSELWAASRGPGIAASEGVMSTGPWDRGPWDRALCQNHKGWDKAGDP